jgi:DNA-binding Lrp family transcriptional regulator
MRMSDPESDRAPKATGTARDRRAVRLDRVDRAILDVLQDHGRMTYQALSERVGLSPRPCLERVRRLEQKGLIRGYAALVEPSALGHDIVALAEISMRDPSAPTRQRLERALCAHPSIVEIQVVSGDYDYIARIVSPTLTAYEALTGAFLADSAFGIGRIHTTFVLKSLKPLDRYPVNPSGE